MPDQRVLERIDAWQAAGLIDAATAERLRADESSRDAPGQAAEDEATAPAQVGSGIPSFVGSIFGPAPTITEVFAYIGGAFVLVAWHQLVATLVQPSYWSEVTGPTGGATIDVGLQPSYGLLALEWGVPFLVLAFIGWRFVEGDARRRRAAGVAFAVATVHAWSGVNAVLPFDMDFTLRSSAATLTAVAAAAFFRRRYAALATQAALIAAIAGFGLAAWAALASALFPMTDFGEATGDPKLKAVLTTAWWLLIALGFAGLAYREVLAQRRASDAEAFAAAERRANLTRFAAGLTAVLGTAVGLAFGDRFQPGTLEPAIGDVVVLIESGVLVWLAGRRGAAYLYPAAIGVIVALSHLNAVYLAEATGTGVALLVEGIILLGAGFYADRARRTLGGSAPSGPIDLDGPGPGDRAELIELPQAPRAS
jgi:hypothetical protein